MKKSTLTMLFLLTFLTCLMITATQSYSSQTGRYLTEDANDTYDPNIPGPESILL